LAPRSRLGFGSIGKPRVTQQARTCDIRLRSCDPRVRVRLCERVYVCTSGLLRISTTMSVSQILRVLAIGCFVIGCTQANVIMYDTEENSIDGSSDFIDLTHLGPNLFGEPDEEVGKLVANFNPETDAGNVEELGSYVEGDMLIDRPEGRNGLSNTATRWPNGVVPFVISGNFAKKGTTNSFGVAYDYASIMHYSSNAFSTNGNPTIEAKKPFSGDMGQRIGFSKSDLAKINLMYGCK
uniref:Metalloendopeptidase n=1 Tax=Anopheles coluzzii TaxID=1518534 RepID=A0A8W7Q184_ANOCL